MEDFRIREFAFMIAPLVKEHVANNRERFEAFLRERAAKAETQRQNSTENPAQNGDRE